MTVIGRLLLRSSGVVLLIFALCEWSEDYQLWGYNSKTTKDRLPGSSVVKFNATRSEAEDTFVTKAQSVNHTPAGDEQDTEAANSSLVNSENSGSDNHADSNPDLENPVKDPAISQMSNSSLADHDLNTTESDEATMGPDEGTSNLPTPENGSRLSLKPPFRIAQVGAPRTGSTFQFRLLDLLARFKSPNGTEMSTKFISGPGLHQSLLSLDQNSSFVVKSHDWQRKDYWKEFQTGNGVVFASADSESRDRMEFADYIQLKENLTKCSLCEVDQYKEIFALSEDEVEMIKRYMGLYERIRLCCGMQMSKYNVMRLNGCDMAAYVDRPSYPHCEDYNMNDVEKEFDALELPYTKMPGDDFKNWAKVGDCSKFDKAVANGRAFNGKPFTSCEDALGEESGGRGSSEGKTTQTEDGAREGTNDVAELAKRPSIQERLIPPFRVVQLGVPRTGSTFQFRLLDVLVRMKSDPTERITTTYVSSDAALTHLLSRNSFVLKSHKYNIPERWTEAQSNKRVVVFASADFKTQHLVNFSDYIQLRENLDECSSCEVDKYQDLFGLTDEDVKLVKTYIGLYEKLRQCCGKQMSRYNAMRLNGCNMTEYKDKPGYPHCEDYDFEEVEREFDSLPLPYTVFPGDGAHNWAKPGDCAKFDERMASGYFFMGERFTTCEAVLNWISPDPFRI